MLRDVAAALADPQHCGVAIVGADGVGKTLLARSAAEPSTAPVHWVVGTATEQVIPFGAFRPLLAGTDVGDTARPAQLLRAAQDRLTGEPQLFVVDDAHYLDRMSATLVYQLALSGLARLIVTARSGAELPDAVQALWDDGLLTRVEVGPLDATAAAALLRTATGSPPTDELVARSKGNALALRHIVLAGGTPKDATLPGLIDAYLSGLPPSARTTLDYLALAEPLRPRRPDGAGRPGGRRAGRSRRRRDGPRRCDGLLGASALRGPGRRGAGSGHRAGAAHVVGQTSCGRDDRAHRRPVAARGAGRRVADVENDTAAGADLVTAAQQALRFGELTLAERLGRAALDRSDGLAARLALGYALAWQGRGLEADAVLAAVDPEQLSPPELMAWALPRAANQFWMLSEPAQATAFLQTTRARVASPGAQATLDALSATFAMNAGTPLRTLRIAGEVLESPHADAVAVGWAASAAALSSARTGQFDDVEALARRATAADHPGLLRFTSGFGRITALVMAGRADRGPQAGPAPH